MRQLIRLAPLLAGLTTSPAQADNGWFVSLYAGQFTDTDLLETLALRTDPRDAYVCVISVGKRIGPLSKNIDMEYELQLAKHAGDQDHNEVNGAFTLRWQTFPWDRYVDTSFAFGNGLSYASEEPPLEIAESENSETSNWLYYILLEFSFSRPGAHHWEAFARIHHRSSVFGTFNGAMGGSNFTGLGIRYVF